MNVCQTNYWELKRNWKAKFLKDLILKNKFFYLLKQLTMHTVSCIHTRAKTNKLLLYSGKMYYTRIQQQQNKNIKTYFTRPCLYIKEKLNKIRLI